MRSSLILEDLNAESKNWSKEDKQRNYEPVVHG